MSVRTIQEGTGLSQHHRLIVLKHRKGHRRAKIRQSMAKHVQDMAYGYQPRKIRPMLGCSMNTLKPYGTNEWKELHPVTSPYTIMC
ncbi:hypothetical protein Y032_0687g1540 [Ancylostoma ceylanicum]|uniref:Uncharacterized protein n=1 Tax=Ancylostoma ceylanicum TaxID=53326 RepID=A0A016WGZ9_9BILA|nr:hypothetical protein Y032_0687g1540 [Ancylostoma ceylanicum]